MIAMRQVEPYEKALQDSMCDGFDPGDNQSARSIRGEDIEFRNVVMGC